MDEAKIRKNEVIGHRNSKLILAQLSKEIAKNLVKLKRNIGVQKEKPICRLRHAAEEDITHIIFECKNLASQRNTTTVDDNPCQVKTNSNK